MSLRLAINGTTVLLELSWQFIANEDIEQNCKKKGGIAIKGSSATQFAQGDGENGIAAMPAWVADNIKNGIVILPLPDQRCWVCGVLAGFIAPETDRIIANNDLSITLEILEDIVPDKLYIIQFDHISLSQNNPIAYADLKIPNELSEAEQLNFSAFKKPQCINGLKKSNAKNMRKILFASIALTSIAIGCYFAYDWRAKQQAVDQGLQIAANMSRAALQEQQRIQREADQYRESHQAMNIYQAVRNVLSHFLLHDSGWQLQSVAIHDTVQANYMRKNGLLSSFLAGKENVSWSQDGGSAVLTRDFEPDLPIPMQAQALQSMNKIQAISLMQHISGSGLQAGLLATPPKWAAVTAQYASTSGIESIYWKVAVPFSHLQSAMSMLQHPNIAVGGVMLNIVGKNCFIEGIIYASNK